MRKHRLLHITILCLIFITLGWVGRVKAETCPPVSNTTSYTFAYGTTLLNGSPVPIGSIVEAYNPRNDLVGCFEVTTTGYYGAMFIYGEDNSVTPSIPGMREGETVAFKVNGASADAAPALIWTNDWDIHEIDLDANFQTVEIQLVAGWNLVSFNLHPEDTSIEVVLSSISGNYDIVYSWNGQTQSWQLYDPSAPPYSNDLHDLDEKQGFWINMTTPDILVVTGNPPQSTYIDLYSLGGGWNMVGYPSIVNRDLPDALQDYGVGADFSFIYAYHANEVGSEWKLFDISAPPYANDLTYLSPGWGYWIRVSEDHTWEVTYSEP